MMARFLAIPALGALFLGLGCTAGLKRADRLYATGDYAGAAAAYAKESASSTSARSARDLYRMAVSVGLPGLPERDALKAEGLLETLLTRFPEDPCAEHARVFLASLKEERRLTAALAALGETLASTRAALAVAEQRTAELKTKAGDQERALDQLRFRLADQEKAAQLLRSQLEGLKQVDLRR